MNTSSGRLATPRWSQRGSARSWCSSVSVMVDGERILPSFNWGTSLGDLVETGMAGTVDACREVSHAHLRAAQNSSIPGKRSLASHATARARTSFTEEGQERPAKNSTLLWSILLGSLFP